MTEWSAIIAYLKARKVRYIDIAVYCGRSEPWVSLVRDGVIKDPSWTPAKKLLELADQYGYEVSQETYDPKVRWDLDV